jgi:hypothetical protein
MCIFILLQHVGKYVNGISQCFFPMNFNIYINGTMLNIFLESLLLYSILCFLFYSCEYMYF